jgi:hypothetical protein
VARNESTFREANERIERRAAEAALELVPFLCECADTACTGVVRLSLAAYESVRRDGRCFLNVPGHERASHGYARVVEHHDGYVVVEKTAEAGELAAELDPRDGTARD